MLFAEFESTFVVSYFTMIASMFVLSTISYDEYDNGYAFLFSMPFSRTSYVKEKYVFSILVGGGGTVGNSHYYSQSADKRHGLAAD